ncbi:uncharacterized protein [Linepithema humile]|uniref:uncharacterized protein n=1 Tax=Linepithema humile TaxID=83485 RepID=UPI00351F36F0
MLKLEVPTLNKVLKNSGGDEKLLEELLSKFRLWLKQQSHLPQDISDQRLKFFIYAVKFNIEQAKKNLDTLYTLRNLVPEFYENYDPFSDDINHFHTYFRQSVCLPKLTPQGYRLYICRLINNDASLYNAWAILKYVCNIYKVEQMYYFTKTLHVACHIHVYTSGIESLYGTIPKAILPADYGGEEPSMDILTDMWRAKLAQQRDCLIKEGKQKTQESLRTNSIINPDELFGVLGTFRKLEID